MLSNATTTTYQHRYYGNYKLTEPFLFEDGFDFELRLKWMKHNWKLSLYLVCGYVMVIFLLYQFMKSRQRFEMRSGIFLWNVGLAVFSLFGTLRVTPDLFYVLREFGFEYSICDASTFQRNSAIGFWSWLFAMSKVVELGDTVFIVLRKRPLTFLHMYHHSSVLTACWYFSAHQIGPVRWATSMNYTIHTFMYLYFALKVLHYKIPKWISMTITTFQIMQMAAGVVIIANIYRVQKSGGYCEVTNEDTTPAMLIAISYLFLFSYFFYDAYLRKMDKNIQKKID